MKRLGRFVLLLAVTISAATGCDKVPVARLVLLLRQPPQWGLDVLLRLPMMVKPLRCM